MSLKTIHITVIASALVLMFSLGVWGIRSYLLSKQLNDLGVGIVSLLTGMILVPYLFWFFRKMEKMSSDAS